MPTFFDFMPNDVHDRFIHYLFSSTKYPDHSSEAYLSNGIADDNLLDTLLHYARSGPDQCCSFGRALYNRLDITDDWRRQRVMEWISLLAYHLRTLIICDAPEFSFPASPPRLPNLERAVITLRPDQLSLIYGSPRLKELTVSILDTRFWDGFVSTVASLRLEVLKLRFLKDCVLQKLSRVELMGLCTVCPAVEFLYLEADDILTPDAWDMIKGMCSLKKLIVNAPIEDEHLSFVQTLQEIGILYVFDIGEATAVGPTVTHLAFLHAYDAEISRLQLLPYLRTLTIRPLSGHERELVGKINNIEELNLSWEHSTCSSHTFQGPHGFVTGSHPVYHEPEGEVLEEIFRTTKHLKSLQIKKAVVSSDVVTKILKIVGCMLETLEICHDWQKEAVPDRMERILKAIARHCPNLKTLSFLETIFHNEQRLPIYATEEQTRRCFRALEEVARAVPGFKSYRHLRSTILHRFTEQQPERLAWHNILQGPCVMAEN